MTKVSETSLKPSAIDTFRAHRLMYLANFFAQLVESARLPIQLLKIVCLAHPGRPKLSPE